MKPFIKVLFFVFSLVLIFYVLLPNPPFPEPLPDALQSNEPADIESPLRRGYYTNYSREEVMLYYKNQLKNSPFMDLPLPTYRLNYPPEEAQTIIRDQTRSTFLEEIAHPLRESFFINGFEPKEDKDKIVIEGEKWRQKIIVKYLPSHVVIRTLVALFALGLAFLLWKEWLLALKQIKVLKRER
jgi:hypothetical protein